MYTPDYKMVGDNKYVGIIKENNKPIMISSVKKDTVTEALRHAESYIHEHYMHELKDKILRCKYSCIVFVVLAVLLSLRSITTPLSTSAAITISSLVITAVMLVAGCLGVLWWTSYFEYKTLIESYEIVPPNFFGQDKKK